MDNGRDDDRPWSRLFDAYGKDEICLLVQIFHRQCGHIVSQIEHKFGCEQEEKNFKTVQAAKGSTDVNEKIEHQNNDDQDSEGSKPELISADKDRQAVHKILDMDLCRKPLRRYTLKGKLCPFCMPLGNDWTEDNECEDGGYGDNEWRVCSELDRTTPVTRAVKKERRLDFLEKMKKSREERRLVREQGQDERMKKREKRWKALRDHYLQEEIDNMVPLKDRALVLDFDGDTSAQFIIPEPDQLKDVCAECRGQLTDESLGVGPARKIHCGHVFHLECIRGSFRRGNLCPLCRQQFKVIRIPSFADPQFYYFYDPPQDEDGGPGWHAVGGYLPFEPDPAEEPFPPGKHWGWTTEYEEDDLGASESDDYTAAYNKEGDTLMDDDEERKYKRLMGQDSDSSHSTIKSTSTEDTDDNGPDKPDGPDKTGAPEEPDKPEERPDIAMGG